MLLKNDLKNDLISCPEVLGARHSTQSPFWKLIFKHKVMNLILTLGIAFGALSTHAMPASIKPAGMTGSAGAGFVTFQITAPEAANFKVDQGVFTAITGEKGFDVFNLYLNLTLSYLSATGNVNYSYTTLTPTTYTASNAAFKADLFQAGLGLKMKIIDGYWIRPYIEAGGVGGFFAMKYTDIKNKVSPSTPADYKVDDSLLDFGKYGEAGAEIQFSDKFGIRAAMRYIDSQTKDFETLGKTPISYKATVYYFSLLAAF